MELLAYALFYGIGFYLIFTGFVHLLLWSIDSYEDHVRNKRRMATYVKINHSKVKRYNSYI